MGTDAGVRAHRDLHARSDRTSDRVGVSLHHHLALPQDRVGHGNARVACREDATWSSERRYEPRAAVEHHPDRFVVEVDAVLDRADAAADGGLDAISRLRVSHHVLAGRARLGDEHLELVIAEVTVPRIVAW